MSQPDPSSWPSSPEWGPVEGHLALQRPPVRTRWFLSSLLFVACFFTVTTLGAVFWLASRTDVSTYLEPMWITPEAVTTIWTTPSLLRVGLSFSLPVLFILLCHELGHYLACRYHGLPATLPYFLPAPIGIGTLGAFIRIRAQITDKRKLFDVGAAGPLAGFVALIPFLVLGIALSEKAPLVLAVPTSPFAAGLLRPGTNLALGLTTLALHGRLPDGVILDYHPFALAAWVGLLVTALNLLPFGQLDGGHIAYAMSPKLQHRFASGFWWCLLLAGFVYPGWIVWALLVRWLIGIRHPPVFDELVELDARRRWLGHLAFWIFVASVVAIPYRWIAVAG